MLVFVNSSYQCMIIVIFHPISQPCLTLPQVFMIINTGVSVLFFITNFLPNWFHFQTLHSTVKSGLGGFLGSWSMMMVSDACVIDIWEIRDGKDDHFGGNVCDADTSVFIGGDYKDGETNYPDWQHHWYRWLYWIAINVLAAQTLESCLDWVVKSLAIKSIQSVKDEQSV